MAPGSEGGTAVIHIAYGPYGLTPFARFIASYRRYASGAAHELVVAWKSFAEVDRAAFEALLTDVPHRSIDVPDGGFDLGTYRHVAAATRYDRYCFLNTNSELLAPNWLAKLEAALDRHGAVAAGASASYQSLATDMLRMVNMRRTWRALAIAKRRLIHMRLRLRYPSFPNPHLRTNAFLIGRTNFLALDMRTLRTKEDASRFESGWRGMTLQLCRVGGKVVLVDAAGRVIGQEDWGGSGTFWQDAQQALLVADNQTRRYNEADEAERRILFRYAWTPLTSLILS